MLVKLFHKKTKEVIATADVLFGLDVAIVNSCDGMNLFEFEQFIENRADLPHTYEIDDIVLKALDLYDRKNEFGRMSEARMLYAIVNSFAMDEDDLEIRPLKTELVSMIALDFRYSNIYIWKSEEDFEYECQNIDA